MSSKEAIKSKKRDKPLDTRPNLNVYLTFLWCFGHHLIILSTRAAVWRCFTRWFFLKTSQNLQEDIFI